VVGPEGGVVGPEGGVVGPEGGVVGPEGGVVGPEGGVVGPEGGVVGPEGGVVGPEGGVVLPGLGELPPPTKGKTGAGITVVLPVDGLAGVALRGRIGVPGKVGDNSNGTPVSATNSGAGTASSARSEGCMGDTGPMARSETRFPQRVLASCIPSVISVSPLCSVNRFFVQ
jgi:hypothetical protein